MKSIASALVKAQREFGPALKSSTNPHFRSKYADLSACIEAVIDALNNNGIYLMQLTEEHQGGVKVSTVFIHESGEQMSGGSLFMPATKQDAQGFGSALSYARRYSLMAACGIAPEDDDGNQATKTAPVAQPIKATPKPQVDADNKPAQLPSVVKGKESGQWQLKVSADPGTDWNDWLAVVVEQTVFALDMAQNRNDVMTIWRTNANIYKIIEQRDNVAYTELLATLKTYKDSFDEQVSE
jgi:hypothetical protein